tara:strand:+ start:156 stop:734 length:579 start_codon:yes stop_codon:yes gene_type:complete
MIRIAVVGGIGSGKSYIAKLFGYPVFNADIEVAKLYRKNRKCYKKLKKILPKYIKSFPIKKKNLTKAVIDDQKNLKKIIKIIHPEIRINLVKFIKKNKNKKFIVLDIPLLIENKINKKNDILVFVDAKKKYINKKLKQKYKGDLKIVNKLKKFQLSVERKKNKSDFVIKNNFKHNSVKKSVKRLLSKILSNV